MLKKFSLLKAKLLLNLNSDTANGVFEIESGHRCQKCFFTL